MEFDILKQYYNGVNKVCREPSSWIFRIRPHRIDQNYCDMWSCERCRKKKKYKLFNLVSELVKEHELVYHFVITFGGNELRSNISYEESYKYVAKAWNKLKMVVKYNYFERDNSRGKAPYLGSEFKYMVFPRSQKSGYCHYHILWNKWIDYDFLVKAKDRYNLGWISLSENTDASEYLNHFKKDNEFMIPVNIRHYSCSRNLDLDILNKDIDDDWKYDNKHFLTIDDDKTVFEQFWNASVMFTGKPVPIEECIKEFVDTYEN